MAVAVAVAVAVSGGGAVAVAVAVAGLTKRFFNHIQKDFLINVWVKSNILRIKRNFLRGIPTLTGICLRYVKRYT